MKVPAYYRDRLYNALLGPIDIIPPEETARKILEQVAAHQLEDIEPVIEEMLDRAVKGDI